MNIIELRKSIHAFLLTKASRVYYEIAPENATFPYVVYSLPSSFTTYDREDFRLEVDVWDNVNDTTALETLVGTIDGDGKVVGASGLNRKHIYISNTLQYDAYRTGRFSIIDENENLKRRQLVYEVKSYL